MKNKTTGHIILCMNKRENKRDFILACGIEAMKAKGYHGTSVKDIVDSASVPKGSFYNYFESKEIFAIEALEEVSGQTIDYMHTILGDRSKKPLDRLEQFFLAGAEWMRECEFKGGCFVGNIAQEMSDSNEAIRLKVRQIFKRKTQLVADVLEEAQQAGDISETLNCLELAAFLFNAWEGALMRMKSSKSCEPIETFIKTWPILLR